MPALLSSAREVKRGIQVNLAAFLVWCTPHINPNLKPSGKMLHSPLKAKFSQISV